ncbi:cytochrome P450 [Fodinicola feengrottensis]|uniref:Cytochrome P450 n=1 Tax=Fodinicola feengrottensis TaxID=435914 RepID=A0ABN2IYZ3_9ACTN
MSTETEPLAFNPFDPVYRADPYPFFERLRTEAPTGRVPGVDVWYVTRYDDCEAILRHPDAGSDSTKSPVYQRLVENGVLRLPQTITGRPSFLFLDPPDHTRLRKLVSKAFTPKVVERMRPRIAEVADELLDEVMPNGRMELVWDIAYPLVFRVMSDMIGVPRADQAKFLAWSKDMSASMDMRLDAPPDAIAQQEKTMREGKDYLTALINERRRQPCDDLISELIQVEEEGGRLSQDELMSTTVLLVGAGTETTVHLICNGIHALLRHPDQLELLRRDPSLIAPAIDESLRWDPPTQLTQRMALTDLKVRDAVIPAGCPVVLVIAAANRDAERWPDPERFDVTRPTLPNLSFSLGRHFCLGPALARAEGQITIGKIIERCPELRIADEGARYRDTFVLRCLDSLPLEF